MSKIHRLIWCHYTTQEVMFCNRLVKVGCRSLQFKLHCVWVNGTCHTDNMGANQSESAQAPVGKQDLVSRIKARVAATDPKKAKELGGVFLFNIIKGTSVYSWTLDLNNVTVYEGEPEEDPDTTFTLNEHYFKQLVQGKEEARAIMQAGRCSVTGDIMRAMQLEPYIKLE